MDFKKLAILSGLLGVVSCATKSPSQATEDALLKNYALAVCLGGAFETEATKQDLNKAANGYMERGNAPIDAYEQVRKLASVWLAKDYRSKHGGQIDSAKCIDFFQSAELHELLEQNNL